MVDFVYPSIFGIGASCLFIVLLIACCIRWLRFQKMRQTTPTVPIASNNSSTSPAIVHSGSCTIISSSRNRQAMQPGATAANRCPYNVVAPPYSIPMANNLPGSGAVGVPGGHQQQTTLHNYYVPYCLYENDQSGGVDSSNQQQQIRSNGATSSSQGAALPPTGHTAPPLPPPYFNDGPPSYEDVVAAGQAIMVTKVKKDNEHDRDQQ